MGRDFSHIMGELREGEPAAIRFYGKITEESATRFNSEFDRLESGRPSLIRVLINCEGGSVLHGMSSYGRLLILVLFRLENHIIGGW